MSRALVLVVASVTLLCGCGSAARRTTRLSWRIAMDCRTAMACRMGAATYGEQRQRLEATLGPGRTTKLDNYSGHWILYPRAALYVGYLKLKGEERAIALVTQSSRYRTPSGVGVGTSVAELRKRVTIACNGDGFVDGKPKFPNPNPDDCSYPRDQTQHPFTDFKIVANRVSEVAIFPGGD